MSFGKFDVTSRGSPAILWILVLLIAFHGAAYAQNLITMDSLVGFENYVAQSAWVSVRVTLSNNGPDVRGRLVVEVKQDLADRGRVYSKEILLPNNSRQQHELYFFSENQSGKTLVQFISYSGKVLAKNEVVTKSVSDNYLVLAINSNKSGLSFIADLVLTNKPKASASAPGPANPQQSKQVLNQYSQTQQFSKKVVVAYLSAAELPERWAGYDAANAVVIGDETLARLNRNQVEALRDWVALRGKLFITGAVDTTGVTDQRLLELFPVKIVGSRAVNALSALADEYQSPIQTAERFLIKEATPVDDAQVKLSEGGLPLVVERRYGTGKVVFLAMDFQRQPLRSWEGSAKLWEALLMEDVSKSHRPTLFSYNTYLTSMFYDLKVAMPTLFFMLAFTLIYLAVIGPINYVVLKRKAKLEWAWITMPVIICFFSVSTYSVARIWRGDKTKIVDRSLVKVFQNTRLAKCESFWGIFPAKKDVHSFKFKHREMFPMLAVAADGKSALVQSNDLFDFNIDMNMWSFKAFTVESAVEVDPIVKVDLDFKDTITGQVSNLSDHALRHCLVVFGDDVLYVGDLSAGESKNILASRLQQGAVFAWYATKLPPSSKEQQLVNYIDMAFRNYYYYGLATPGGVNVNPQVAQIDAQKEFLSSDKPILIGFVDDNRFFDFQFNLAQSRESLSLVIVYP